MHQRWLQAVAVIAGIGAAPLVPTNSNAQCCRGGSTVASAERPARVSRRVEQLLDKRGGREALIAAAMGNERFMADYIDAIAQDQSLRDHAARFVRETPGATSRSFDRRFGRAAEQLVRDERHRDDVIDALLADQAFMEGWSMAVGSDPRWREDALHAWTGEGAGSSMRPQDRSVRSAAHYTCPMHPEVDSDRPGRCPKCGMDLVRRAS